MNGHRTARNEWSKTVTKRSRNGHETVTEESRNGHGTVTVSVQKRKINYTNRYQSLLTVPNRYINVTLSLLDRYLTVILPLLAVFQSLETFIDR